MKDIVLHCVDKSFGAQSVLRRFSYRFRAGSITCIEGASGCGKTTLLSLIAGLQKPDSGSITGVPERIAFVFQEDRLCEDFTVFGNLRFVCGRAMQKSETENHLRALSLSEYADKPIRKYSGGMKRRVSIAQAVCYSADLLLLDEPFKGLDPALKEKTMDYILRHSKGKTVICVTHDSSEAAYLGGDRLHLG